MKKPAKAFLPVTFGILPGFPVFRIADYTMARTSTPGFRGSSHEIRFAFHTWKTSTHEYNAQGFVAEAWTFGLIRRCLEKSVSHLKNYQCMKYRRNLLFIPDPHGDMPAHRTFLYPLPGREKKRVDCHQDLVHNHTPLYRLFRYRSDSNQETKGGVT